MTKTLAIAALIVMHFATCAMTVAAGPIRLSLQRNAAIRHRGATTEIRSQTSLIVKQAAPKADLTESKSSASEPQQVRITTRILQGDKDGTVAEGTLRVIAATSFTTDIGVEASSLLESPAAPAIRAKVTPLRTSAGKIQASVHYEVQGILRDSFGTTHTNATLARSTLNVKPGEEATLSEAHMSPINKKTQISRIDVRCDMVSPTTATR